MKIRVKIVAGAVGAGSIELLARLLGFQERKLVKGGARMRYGPGKYEAAEKRLCLRATLPKFYPRMLLPVITTGGAKLFRELLGKVDTRRTMINYAIEFPEIIFQLPLPTSFPRTVLRN
ncbi:hypothetical protein KQX54_017038 [Cotesia glomerata]|uniref:Uncharacterized protein n=1 Tax=Cotesia glomerata TaxID=32391 RepID=A0AAV7I750_COTGL|nr:hypothetical protein KQX54_017038 [Cotesia glomerata]